MSKENKEKSPWQIFKESGGKIKPETKQQNFESNVTNDMINVVIDKVEIVPGVWIYKNVFKDVDLLVDLINEHFGQQWQDGEVYGGADKKGVNKKSRDCSVLVLSEPNEKTTLAQNDIHNIVKLSMSVCLSDYMTYYSMNLSEFLPDSWQVLKYGHGQHFEGHADDSFRFPRTVSITAYLNDNYTGGELDYKHFGLLFKPEKGDILIFPSNYVYNHQVNPVDTGVRYALVNWFRWKTMKVDMMS